MTFISLQVELEQEVHKSQAGMSKLEFPNPAVACQPPRCVCVCVCVCVYVCARVFVCVCTCMHVYACFSTLQHT